VALFASIASMLNTPDNAVDMGHQLTYGLSSLSRRERRVVLTCVSFVNGLTSPTNSEVALPNQPLHVGYGSALNLSRNSLIPSLTSVFPSPLLNLTLAQRVDLFLSFALSDLISSVPSTLPLFPSKHTLCCAQHTGVQETVVEALLVTIYSTWVTS
jgi:hypothetical protein